MYRISFNPLLFLLGLVSFLILLPALVFSQPSGEIDPYSIHYDGTTTTTAPIPFEQGIRVRGGSTSFPNIGHADNTDSGLHIGYSAPSLNDLYFITNGSTWFWITPTNGYIATGLTVRPIGASGTGAIGTSGTRYGSMYTVTLNASGTTTLATSLTGILKGTSGLVAVASSSDILTAIGTIDISSNTNLAVTSPITLTGDTVGFDFSTNNTWTGTNLYQNTVTIQDDIKLFIGDNSNFGGNISFENDQDTSGSVLVSAENGFAGEFTYATGLNVRVEDNFNFGSSSHTTLGLFGAVPSSAVISPTGTTDGLAVRKSTISSGIRALSVQAEWDVQSGGTSSSNLNGFNAFAFTSAAATTGITTTTQGGGMRNRQVVRQRSTAGAQIAKMSAGSNQVNLDAGVATVTTGVAFNAEVPVVGAGSTLTNFFGFLGDWPGGTVSGTITTAYGMFLPALGVAGTNYELWLDTDAGIFLRESGNQISSPSAGVIQYDATTRHDFNNTVRVNSLTASRLVKTDGSKNLTSLSPSSAYTPTNVTTDRSYDANATKVDELADVLGTLIADLQTAGILQ